MVKFSNNFQNHIYIKTEKYKNYLGTNLIEIKKTLAVKRKKKDFL